LRSYSSNERKEVTKMQKIYFWDNGIRNAVIGDFRPLTNRTDVGLLWENFLISERMKMNSYLKRDVKTYFWRNLQQREVDFIEIKYQQIEAFEIKWNTLKNHKITRAFTNIYPNTKNEIITPENFAEFCFLKD
jgi:predicted AAA+ superfamily ATPase